MQRLSQVQTKRNIFSANKISLKHIMYIIKAVIAKLYRPDIRGVESFSRPAIFSWCQVTFISNDKRMLEDLTCLCNLTTIIYVPRQYLQAVKSLAAQQPIKKDVGRRLHIHMIMLNIRPLWLTAASQRIGHTTIAYFAEMHGSHGLRYERESRASGLRASC